MVIGRFPGCVSPLAEDSRMASLAPPPAPPRISLSENDDFRRVHLRLVQIFWSIATVLLTVWICTFGPIPAILAIMVAKHVLVAILVMGLGVDSRDASLGNAAPPGERMDSPYS
jgi:hypothetical protein